MNNPNLVIYASMVALTIFGFVSPVLAPLSIMGLIVGAVVLRAEKYE